MCSASHGERVLKRRDYSVFSCFDHSFWSEMGVGDGSKKGRGWVKSGFFSARVGPRPQPADGAAALATARTCSSAPFCPTTPKPDRHARARSDRKAGLGQPGEAVGHVSRPSVGRRPLAGRGWSQSAAVVALERLARKTSIDERQNLR